MSSSPRLWQVPLSQLREPSIGDAAALGAVHVRAWQRAYRGGLMPDEYLDSLSVDERTAVWKEALQRPARPGFVRILATEESGEAVGFVVAGPEGGEPGSPSGEIYALNVEPEVWGRGHGRALLQAATEKLAAHGFTEAILWVHPGNTRARRFYEWLGWSDDGLEREAEVFGITVPEVRYSKVLSDGGSS